MFKLYSILLLPAVKAMNGNRGRMAVQAGHGWLHAYWDAEKRFPEAVAAYRSQTAFKVCLVTDSEEAIQAMFFLYSQICGASLVKESGSKSDGTTDEAAAFGLTCLGLGPLHADHVRDDLRALKSFL